MTIITALTGSPWTTLLLGLISITGLVLTVVFYVKSRRFRMPLFRSTNLVVVGQKTKGIGGLTVAYNGTNVATFSVARFAIWNAGNEAIDASDVAPSDPLRLAAVGPTEILDARITFVKKQANNFRVSVDKERRYVAVEFDYFHRSEGVVLEVFHTGKSRHDLQIRGTIKGVDSFRNVESTESKYVFGWFDVLERPFRWIKNETITMIVVVSITMATLPIYLVLKLLDVMRRTFYRPPKEYELRD